MLNDLKAAWRTLCHSPGFAAVAVITLALAIGANTAIFSIADAVLFRPLPYAEPDRLHTLQSLDRSSGIHYGLTPYEYLWVIDDYHRGLGPIGFLDHGSTIVVPTSDGAEGIQTVAATANYFQILSIRPSHGRIFDARDAEQPGRSAMLSYDTWQRWFGGDERIVGHTVRLGSAQFDIVGILPRDFLFPSWLAGAPEVVTVMEPVRRGVEGGTVHSIVRLERGVTREQAQAEIEALTAPIAARRSEPDTTLVLDDVRSVLYPEGRTIMPLLLVTAGLVLLIGCANLANVLLVRTRRREHEAGVRAALGASRTRLVRPLIFESLLTSLAGAALAVFVTSMTFDTLIQQVPRVAYRYAPVGVDLRVLLFALGLGLLSGLLFGAIPSWRAARLDVQALIRRRHFRENSHSKFLGRPLVAVQVALAIVLVFGAAVSVTGLVRVLSVPLGFDPENVLTVGVSPPEVEGRDKAAFYARAIETLAGRADVVSVGATHLLPPSNSRGYEPAWTPESKDSGVESGIVPVLPGYFETAGIPLVRGRLPDWSDFQSRTSIAVVSESAARALFPTRDPVGAVLETRLGRQFTVVGVVADVGNLRPGQQPQPYSYVIPGENTPGLTLVARVRSRRGQMLADIRREISSLAPETIVSIGWWQDSIDERTEFRSPRFQTLVLGSFGTLALVLSSLGIFSVVAFLVASRTHEMGVRLAVGATPNSLIRWMVGQALAPVAAGILLGLGATEWLRPLAEAQFYKVETQKPLTLAVVAACVLASALLAAYLPARRAGNVDPIVVLRQE